MGTHRTVAISRADDAGGSRAETEGARRELGWDLRTDRARWQEGREEVGQEPTISSKARRHRTKTGSPGASEGKPKKAEARLRKALERVATVEAETRHREVAVSVRAQIYLPEARAIVPEIEKTVASWRAEVTKAELALKG